MPHKSVTDNSLDGKVATPPAAGPVAAQNVQANTGVEPTELEKFRQSVLVDMLALAAENYNEAIRVTGVLDDKAQKTGGVAGAFLAAGLAFLKPDTTLGNLGGKVGLSLLAAGIVLLLVSIGICLRVMWVRAAMSPLSVFDIEGMRESIFKLADNGLSSKLRENFIRDQCRVSEAALLDQIGLNESKARWLRAAQGALALAMLAVGALLFLNMLRIWEAPHLLSI